MCRILIVDDHQAVRRRIRELLHSREDWVVCGEAADGLEAVEQARILRPDLILMDVSMPNMNGLDATEIIRREFREARVLILSQNDPAVVRRQAAEANAQGFVEKSNLHSELIAVIASIFSTDDNPGMAKAN